MAEIKISQDEDAEIYSTKLDKEFCKHKFYRAANLIKCRKCTLEFFDPQHTFPINLTTKNE